MLVFVAALAAAPLGAQQQPAPAAAPTEGKQIVAVVNGEVITQAKLDSLWERLGAQMRKQYEATGGKQGFLENYLRKRLLIQEAIKSGFDKRADVQLEVEAAKESTIFDLYVRDVVSQQYVTDDAVKAYYTEHKAEFSTPERVKVRHIVVTPQNNLKEAAREKIEKAATELYPFRASPNPDPQVAAQIFVSRFAQAAQKYSEDATATQGGDLGWVERGMLDKTFEEAAFNLKKGMMSGIIETKFGYHLIYVEDHKSPGTESLDSARADIREFLMAQNAAKVMEDVNRELAQLRMNSKITVYPENIR
ncbi:MAG TPA: peptidylprolyl isomerase [Thermoanaerobaculia bacterium]|nr:peptidylprolyl isomerase [Thermoanaerobaculia bacterium]